MLESVLQLWDEIEQLLVERKETHFLEDIDKNALQRLFDFLQPIRLAILQLETSSKYPTLPLVTLIFQKFLKIFAPSDEDKTSESLMKSKMREHIQKKLRIEMEHQVATTLHPSFRKLEMEFLSQSEKRAIYAKLRRMISINSAESPENTEVIVASDGEEPAPAKRSRLAADEFLDEFCASATESVVSDELAAYLADPVSKVSIGDILAWWKKSETSFPKLALIAKKYLAVPASSAASESAFRYAGLTITDLRNRLSPDTVSDLLFIRHNSR